MDNKPNNTLDESPPVFKSWNHWYWAVIIVNILFGIWMVVYFSSYN